MVNYLKRSIASAFAVLLFAHPILGVQTAHEHGVAQVNLSVGASRVVLEMEIPGDSVVGFEHTPSTPQEKQALDNAVAQFKKLALFSAKTKRFFFLKPVDLTLESAKVNLGDEDHHDDHEDDDHHHHHDEHDHEEEHLTFFVTQVYSMNSDKPLKVIDLLVFDHFKNLNEVRLNVVTEQTKISKNLTPQQSSVSL